MDGLDGVDAAFDTELASVPGCCRRTGEGRAVVCSFLSFLFCFPIRALSLSFFFSVLRLAVSCSESSIDIYFIN